MPPKSPLDDPEQAAFAWARYKRIMRFMLLVTIIVVAAAMAAIFWSEAEVSPHFFIGLTMLLASALMGLVFLSNGTGHDESIHNPLAEEDRWHESDDEAGR